MSSATTQKEIALSPPRRWRADLSLAFVALIWGSTFIVVKSALGQISTMYFLALRFSVACVCMAALFAPAFRRGTRRAIASGLLGGALAGVFLWAGYVLQTFGLKYTSAGKSGFITGLYIVLVPLVSAALYRRAPRATEALGILVATAGLALLAVPSLEFNLNRGDLLTVACAVAFAFHLIVLGYYSQREMFEAVALGQIASAALLSGLSLAVEPARAHWSPSIWIAVGLTGIFGTAVAFAVQTWAQQFTTATRTALIFALEPVFALATAIILAGETLSVAGMVGAAFILCGILLVELKRPVPV